MKKLLIIALSLMALTTMADDTEFTTVEELTKNYFLMAYNNDGTWSSPYWTKATNQNVQQGMSAKVCGGKDNYYLLRAQKVTYRGETCYRISISNKSHAYFSGIGGGHYMNSAGWVFFAGVCESSGQSHVYGQDFDAGGLWRITFAAGKGFQFQCIGNSQYINGTMGHSSSANKYYWRCFADGSLYGDEKAMKTTPEYQAYEAMNKQLQTLADDSTNLVVDDALRQQLTSALTQAGELIAKGLTLENLNSANQKMRTAAQKFIKNMTVLNRYEVDLTCLLVNPSFESGDLTGWSYGSLSGGDVGVKDNSGVYVTDGLDGRYLFNTWVNSDSYMGSSAEQYVEQSLTGMPKGEYRLTALASSSSKIEVELYGGAQATGFVPTTKSDFGDPRSLTIFFTAASGKLTLGMRSPGWFRADNFRLYYYGITDEYEQKRRFSVSNLYEQIASQALERSAYDSVLAEVKEKLLEPDITDAGITEQNARLRTALMELVRTGTTATGQFDITLLLPNTNTVKRDNTQTLTRITQTLTAMPAGHYTFTANALYRSTDTAAAMELYEAGTDNYAAYIYAGADLARIQNIFADAPYTAASASPNNIYSTIDGRGVPLNEGTALATFKQGRYPCSVETDLAEDGRLTVGFRIDATKLSNNWFMAANQRLYYGATPTATVEKSIAAGELTPLCLPIDIEASEVGELFAIGSIVNDKALIYPVSRVKAGQPCVVRAAADIEAFTVPLSALTASVGSPDGSRADVMPLPWDGGTVKPVATTNSWTTTTVDGKRTRRAETLSFVIADPMNADFTVNMENLQARRFLSIEDYTSTTSSHIGNYNDAPPARRDLPNSVGLPIAPLASPSTPFTVTLSEHADMSDAQSVAYIVGDNGLCYVPNLIPQRTYYYELKTDSSIVGRGRVSTEGRLRMLYVPSISNVRDLGGWSVADGRRIRYGLVFRGGELNGGHTATKADIKRLRDLNVGAEIDLRFDSDNSGAGTSVFDFKKGSTFYYANANDCYPDNMTSTDSRKRWKEEFNLLVNNLKAGRSVYFHCIWGADRTGLFSMLIEGLLGVAQDQSNKNYELTSFSLAGSRVRGTQNEFFDYIKGLSGATLQDKFNTFFTSCLGVSQTNIDRFREIMLTDGSDDSSTPVSDISSASHERGSSECIFNLQGQRLTAPARGICIKNGKIIVIK